MFSKLFILSVLVSSSLLAQSSDPLGDKIQEIEDPIGAKIKEVNKPKNTAASYAQIAGAITPALDPIMKAAMAKESKRTWEAYYLKEMDKRKKVLEKILSERSASELPALTPSEMDRLIEAELNKSAPANCTKLESEYFACPEGTYTFTGSKLPKAIADSERTPKEVSDKKDAAPKKATATKQ